MQFDQDKYDELVMGLVVEGGNARSLAMEAIQSAKKGDLRRRMHFFRNVSRH